MTSLTCGASGGGRFERQDGAESGFAGSAWLPSPERENV
jgi:hypothetical protein